MLGFLLAEALLCTGIHQDEGRYGHDGARARQGVCHGAFGAKFRHVRAGQLVLWPSTLFKRISGSETPSWNVVAEAAVRHGERLVRDHGHGDPGFGHTTDDGSGAVAVGGVFDRLGGAGVRNVQK